MDESEIEEIYNHLLDDINIFKGQTILITGCCGFLGKILTHLFLYANKFIDAPCTVIGIDNFIVGLPKPDIEDKNFIFFNEDINSPALKEKLEEFDITYCIAAHGIADPYVYTKYPRATLEGSFALFNLCEILKDKQVKSCLFFSSSEIIGGFQNQIPTPELEECCFKIKGERSAYDTSKLLCTVIPDTFFRKYGLKTKYVLPFNVYSSNMSLKDKRVVPSYFANLIKNKKIPVFNKGLETRTFVHATDFIVGVILVLLYGKDNQHYNIGGIEEVSMINLAELIQKIVGFGEIEYIKPAQVYQQQPLRRKPDITLVLTLGYKVNISLEDGLTRCWKFLSNNL